MDGPHILGSYHEWYRCHLLVNKIRGLITFLKLGTSRSSMRTTHAKEYWDKPVKPSCRSADLRHLSRLWNVT
jgi:hypothetical protein